MVAEGGRALDIVVDAPGNARDLDTEPFIESPRASKAAVTSQDDQCCVFQEGREVPDRRLLNLFLLKILKAAAADGAARMAAHAARILFGHRFDPVVRETEKSVPDEVDVQAESVAFHAQLFQSGAGAGEVPSR